jgi:hypothetical protein
MTIIDVLARYKNGGYDVTLYSDGTKERTGTGLANFPESIDIKITDYCDMGCPWCHESSTKAGVHGDLDYLLDRLSFLPKGIELAIGGGNPLSHPEITPFLLAVKSKGWIANLTINQGHFNYEVVDDRFIPWIKSGLVYGVGVSVKKRQTAITYMAIKRLQQHTENVVFHVIAGVDDYSIIDYLKTWFPYQKILILGYKDYGLGVQYRTEEVTKKLKVWTQQIHNAIGTTTLCFDNLAIEQLQIKRFFTNEEWVQFYMGDDFTHSMYCDATKQEWARTSRSQNRVSMQNASLTDFFNSKVSDTPAQ